MPMLTMTSETHLNQVSIEELVRSRVGDFVEAAALWARLYYEHAALHDESLRVHSFRFEDDFRGVVRVDFDWTIQDGCSDVCRDGTGYLELQFSASGTVLQLEWSRPERPGTADEF